jgi:hypothetical protein
MASLGALAALFVVVGTTRLQAGDLYTQPTNYFGGYYSQNDTSPGGVGNWATVYDNFTLGASATIGSVSWVGSYYPSAGTVTGVTISIWADNSGAPNLADQLYTTHVSGNAGETYLGLDILNDPTYSYSAAIDFNAAAGTQYWLSIVSDAGYPPGWAWESGTGGDGISYQDYLGSLYELQVDEAFTLDAVPEPASAALLGGGLALLAVVSRRFKKRSA